MLSGKAISGTHVANNNFAAGDTAQWTLANDGTVAWPEGTSLRLVGGPILICPFVNVPPLLPSHTVELELEVKNSSETGDVYFSLVTPDLLPFGEIIHARVDAKPQQVVSPIAVVIASPAEGACLDALQGEIKHVEWTVANFGTIPWPEDVSVNLIYNTPGFEHIPSTLAMPSIEPGMTAIAEMDLPMPERAGIWKAMWLVTSPTHADFGDILEVEFKVVEFPFMEWLCEETISETASTGGAASSWEMPGESEPEVDTTLVGNAFSVAVSKQNHHFMGPGEVDYPPDYDEETIVSLGRVSDLKLGQGWILELALTNNGTNPWPESATLKCCFGTGLNCKEIPLEGAAIQSGETVVVLLDLTAPKEPSRTAWVMTVGDHCFGPALMIQAEPCK